jgi:hypothetical protein
MTKLEWYVIQDALDDALANALCDLVEFDIWEPVSMQMSEELNITAENHLWDAGPVWSTRTQVKNFLEQTR